MRKDRREKARGTEIEKGHKENKRRGKDTAQNRHGQMANRREIKTIFRLFYSVVPLLIAKVLLSSGSLINPFQPTVVLGFSK